MSSKEYMREYREKNKAKINANARAWHSKKRETDSEYAEKKNAQSRRFNRENKDSRKNSHLKLKYKLTIEEWNKLFDSQGRRCAICLTFASKRWHTDHDHITGIVRGILCQHCNHLLGKANDNVQILQAAIDYLGAHSCHS